MQRLFFGIALLMYSVSYGAYDSALASSPWEIVRKELEGKRKKIEAERKQIQRSVALNHAIEIVADLSLFDPHHKPLDSEDKHFWAEHEAYTQQLNKKREEIKKQQSVRMNAFGSFAFDPEDKRFGIRYQDELELETKRFVAAALADLADEKKLAQTHIELPKKPTNQEESDSDDECVG